MNRDDETTLSGRTAERPSDPGVTPAGNLGDAIVVLLHPPQVNPGRRFTLHQDELVVGRRSENDLPLDVDSVSRKHARLIRRADGSWWVEDLGSTNGTFVNQTEVHAPHPLVDGDLVRFGEAIVKFLVGSNVERAYHEEIYRISILDGLTGVHNRRFFEEVLEREVSRSSRRGGPVALVVFDIDLFKRVNDVLGHLAGDAVLQSLCRRLKPRIRREDLLARIGGEEFACILADSDLAGARAFAEDLRVMVERDPFFYEGREVVTTISLGVAAIAAGPPVVPSELRGDRRETERRSMELMRAADEQLYAAKRGGRNRVAG